MADERNKQQGLQQAASVIFALVAVVPLLIFAYTLHALGAIRSTQAQISLGLALAISLLGFWMFRMRRPAGSVTSTAAPAAVPAGATSAATAVAPRPANAAMAAGPAKKIAVDRGGIPGVGNIREIAEVARTMDVLWQREAAAHVGKRVSISVANSKDPLIGVISEVSDDGFILDQADGQNGIAYRRVTGIDRLTGQA